MDELLIELSKKQAPDMPDEYHLEFLRQAKGILQALVAKKEQNL